MINLKEIRYLIKKDITLEMRNKYALNSLILYVAATMMVLYLAVKVVDNKATWNALFWVVCLFSAINAASRSFTGEGGGMRVYMQTLASPASVILAKTCYNVMVTTVLGVLSLLIYSLLFGFYPQDGVMFTGVVVLGNICFSAALTMVSAIATGAGSSGNLLAVLGLPLVVPIIIVAVKVAKNAMDGLDRTVSVNELLTLLLLTIITFICAVMLYPYIAKQ